MFSLPLEERDRRWKKIREEYDSREIVNDWNQEGFGIGILFINQRKYLRTLLKLLKAFLKLLLLILILSNSQHPLYFQNFWSFFIYVKSEIIYLLQDLLVLLLRPILNPCQIELSRIIIDSYFLDMKVESIIPRFIILKI